MRLRLAHGFEQQHGGAATALAEARAQGKAFQPRITHAVFKHLPRNCLCLVFQMAAADGVVQALAADHHLRARIARRRTALFDDSNQHAGFALLLQVGECFDPGGIAHVQSFPGGSAKRLHRNDHVALKVDKQSVSTLRQAGVVSVVATATVACFNLRICSTPHSTRSGVAGASIFGWAL